MPSTKKAIIFDGKKWHVRRVRVIEHDLDRDEKVYRCNRAISNDHPSLADVPEVRGVLRSFSVAPKMCCSDKCTRVSRFAQKLSDFWISSCEEHQGTQLSVTKAIEQLKGTF